MTRLRVKMTRMLSIFKQIFAKTRSFFQNTRQSVISTRTSVISARRVRLSYAKCDFHTHECDFVPLECDFYTQSVIFIRKVSYPVIIKDFARWLLDSTKTWWTLAWIGSYLTGREQLVKASGSQSRRFSVRSGIPQGTQLKIFMCNDCFHSWQLCALLFEQWIHKQNQ
jgi:hypothetical protein